MCFFFVIHIEKHEIILYTETLFIPYNILNWFAPWPNITFTIWKKKIKAAFHLVHLLIYLMSSSVSNRRMFDERKKKCSTRFVVKSGTILFQIISSNARYCPRVHLLTFLFSYTWLFLFFKKKNELGTYAQIIKI